MSEPKMASAPAGNQGTTDVNATTTFVENHYHTDKCVLASTSSGDVCLTAIGAGSSSPRYEVYLFGWCQGRESLRARLERLEWERDLWYFVANNKGKTPADFYRHQTSELWREAVAA